MMDLGCVRRMSCDGLEVEAEEAEDTDCDGLEVEAEDADLI